MYRILLAAILALLLAACSGVKLAYNQLDWFIVGYIDDFVSLNDAQTRLVKRQLADLRQWHCSTQLNDYATRLRTINEDFQNGPIDQARLSAHQAHLRSYWVSLMTQLAPLATELLATLSPKQIDELFAHLEKENAKFRKTHVDRPEAKMRKEAAKEMRGRLERWIGNLTHAQHKVLTAWSEQVELNGPERLELRQRWQAALRQALDQRHDHERLAARVRGLLLHADRFWSDAYREKYERLQDQNLTLVVEIGRMLEPHQRETLARRALGWAEDFDQLACAAQASRTASASDSLPRH